MAATPLLRLAAVTAHRGAGIVPMHKLEKAPDDDLLSIPDQMDDQLLRELSSANIGKCEKNYPADLKC